MANYLYNGVEAPALPETALPVAMILHTSVADMLVLVEAAPTISGESIVWADGVRQHYQLIDGAWVLQLEDTGDGIVGELGDGIAWCNVDILYDDGTVYLAGSEPVPVKWPGLKSWLTGFALGLAGKPLPLAVQKEPVAWLYNGVRLPKLPEWDRETYPYAVMIKRLSNKFYELYVADQPVFYRRDDGDEIFLHASDSYNGGVAYLNYPETDTAWSKVYLDDYRAWYQGVNDFVWANHDIPYEDGSIGLAASDPIPVYE